MRGLRKLSSKISIIVAFIVIFVIIAIGTTTLIQTKKIVLNDSKDIGKQITYTYSKDIESRLNASAQSVISMGSYIENSKRSGKVTREDATEMLKKYLGENKYLDAIYVVFEPNAYDSKDATYGNTIGHDDTGRFVTYLAKDNNNISVEAITDYDGTSEDNYYQIAKTTKKTFLMDPIQYEAGGETSWITAVVVPVLDESGNFIGVVGGDIKLDNLQRTIVEARPLNGYATLITETGNILAQGQEKDYVGKSMKEYLTKFNEEDKVEGLLNSVKQNKYSEYIIKGSVNIYTPIKIDGVEGNWAFGAHIPKESIYSDYNKILRQALIIALVVLIISILIIYIVIKKITKPIEETSTYMKKMGEADFTDYIPDKLLKRKDEIGLLGKSLLNMKENTREILESFQQESNNLKEYSHRAIESINTLAISIENVSATTEELSANMEETAASSQEINSSSNIIENEVKEIALKIEEGSNLTREIEKRAEVLKREFSEAIKESENIINITGKGLSEALEESNEVSKIQVLSQSIMEITEKTNLLALNAAIEAARAGESGKGFAVVAGEITKLAESSKDTVVQIQSITDKVISSVEKLVSSSNEMLRFMNNDVSEDYNKMINTTGEYNKDIKIFAVLIDQFNNATEKILELVKENNSNIDGIATAASEGAMGTTEVAGKISDVLNEAESVKKVCKNVAESTDKMNSSIAKFKV